MTETLRVWHIRNLDLGPQAMRFCRPVTSVEEAKAILRDWVQDDLPDEANVESNAQGLEVFDPETASWSDWENEEGEDIDTVIDREDRTHGRAIKYCIRVRNEYSKLTVLAAITAFDPHCVIDPESNPVTFWITSRCARADFVSKVSNTQGVVDIINAREKVWPGDLTKDDKVNLQTPDKLWLKYRISADAYAQVCGKEEGWFVVWRFGQKSHGWYVWCRDCWLPISSKNSWRDVELFESFEMAIVKAKKLALEGWCDQDRPVNSLKANHE